VSTAWCAYERHNETWHALQNPMDLGTVSQRLESNFYSSASTVADDICLVWHNCQTFNEPGSDVYQSCDELSRFFDQQWKQAKLPAPTVRPTNHVLNLQTPFPLPDIFSVIVLFLLRSNLSVSPAEMFTTAATSSQTSLNSNGSKPSCHLLP